MATFMCLKRNWEAFDVTAGNRRDTFIPIGWYEVERIKNPFDFEGCWLVIKGTLIGASEGSWRQWINDGEIDWENYEVVITDTLPEGVVLSTL